VFLDSRDLIDCVEHNDPCDYLTLRDELRTWGLALVYTSSNVLEVVPRNRPLSYVVDILNRLESLPHVFIRHTSILPLEFSAAVNAFENRCDPQPVLLPSESTFWRLLPHPAPTTDRDAFVQATLDGLPLSEQLRFALMDGGSVDADPQRGQDFASVLKVHRDRLKSDVPSKRTFRLAFRSQLHSLRLNVANTMRFADWAFRNPQVCPAWRLGHESFEELRRDRSVITGSNDVNDYTHLYLIPYVAAATLDHQWREYCGRAHRRLSAIGIDLPYIEHIYRDTAALLEALKERRLTSR
jgi:hypothetical protein